MIGKKIPVADLHSETARTIGMATTRQPGKDTLSGRYDCGCTLDGAAWTITLCPFHHGMEQGVASAQGGWRYEYAVVYDGEPRMDGTHQRVQLGTFRSLDEAREGAAFFLRRGSTEKPGLRIEQRPVGPWSIVEQADKHL
jgi:hypothetical protein